MSATGGQRSPNGFVELWWTLVFLCAIANAMLAGMYFADDHVVEGVIYAACSIIGFLSVLSRSEP